MLSITGLKGNANPNNIKILPHSVTMGTIKNTTNNKLLVRLQGKGTLKHCW
jgi:hypothetical protein